MTIYVHVRCLRCGCVNVYEKDSPEHRRVNRDGFGMYVARTKPGLVCICYCHGNSSQRVPPRLVGKTVEVQDEDVPF